MDFGIRTDNSSRLRTRCSMNCLVVPHHAGLFSNINKVVTCLRAYDRVGIDWSYGSLYGDCWNDLFEPMPRPEGPVELVSEFPFYDITAACAGILYQNACWHWRSRYNLCWRKLRVRKELLESVPFGREGDFVAVQIRSNAIAGEQLSGRMQTLDEYAFALSKVLREGSAVFVMSSDEESLQWMRDRFPCFYRPDVRRGARRDLPEPHLSVPQTAEDAKNCLLEVLMVAQCRAFIHPVSNMATAALYINPQLESIYLK